jgi:hypothetical protein
MTKEMAALRDTAPRSLVEAGRRFEVCAASIITVINTPHAKDRVEISKIRLLDNVESLPDDWERGEN